MNSPRWYYMVLSLALLIGLSILSFKTVDAGVRVFHYYPASDYIMSGISGHVFSEPTGFERPVRSIAMSTYGIGEIDSNSNAVTWAVKDFSGFAPGEGAFPFPSGRTLGDYQRGLNGYGWSAVQVMSDTMGFQLNTYSSPYVADYTSHSIHAGVDFDNPSLSNIPRPWVGNLKTACLSFFTKIPTSYVGGSKNFAYSAIIIRDRAVGESASDQFFHLQALMYDNTYTPSVNEWIGIDEWAYGTGGAIVATYYRPGTTYASLKSNSQSTSASNWTNRKFFGTCISESQLINVIRPAIIDAYHDLFPPGDPRRNKYDNLSTNPDDYEVLVFSIAGEIALDLDGNGVRDPNTGGHMGMWIDDIHFYSDP